MSESGAPQAAPAVASIARVYNYWLGGDIHYPVDREAAEHAIAANPGIVADARASRAFLVRAVRFLAGECGIRQFLDIGAGLPTASNTHQVAQAVAPASRIVYVDSDPAVMAHSGAMLVGSAQGATAYLQNDLREVDQILDGAAKAFDLSQPVAVMLMIMLHLIPDADDPHGVVGRLMSRLAPGSYLVLSHPASDIRPAAMAAMAKGLNTRLAVARGTMRDKSQIAGFFDGMALADPGVVQLQQWRPGPDDSPAEVPAWCGIARSPAS